MKILSVQEQTSKRGLASASEETRERVARSGGEAPTRRGDSKRHPQKRDNPLRKKEDWQGGADGEEARQQRTSTENMEE